MGRATLGTIVVMALALAGCGGDEAKAPAAPKLPGALAAALAYESDQISASLAAGRECAAHRQAQALRAHVGDAVASGDVAPALGREMSAAANSLDDGIQCEPAPKPAPKPEKQAPTACESLTAQLTQLEAQVEQAKAQEKAAHGQDKQAAKDLREQYEEQAKQLEEQLKYQCEELQGGGSEEFVPPGQQQGHPGNGNGNSVD